MDSNKQGIPVETTVDFRGHGWRANIPSAIVIACLTTLSTSLTTRCGSGYEELERAQRQNYDALDRRLESIETGQRGLIQRIDKEASEQKNRDLFQDLAIKGIK